MSIFSFPDDNMHCYFGDLIWDCLKANFVNFWQLFAGTHPYFHFRIITWMGFSPNLLYQFWRSYLPATCPDFCFQTMTSSKYQWIFTITCYMHWYCRDLGPVVQSVVSLTSSLRVISLTILADSIYNILIFFAEKMWVAFALKKLLTFFQQKISAYLRITWCKF